MISSCQRQNSGTSEHQGRTKKWKYTAQQSNKPGSSVGRPPILIVKFGEYKRGGAVRCETCQRNQNGKEAKHMENEDHAFDFGESSGTKGVDRYTKK